MNSEKILFKEETGRRSKGSKFLILLIGDIIAVVCLIIIEAFRTNLQGWDLVLNYLLVGVFGIFMIAAILFTWAFYHSHFEIKITRSGMMRSLRMPPFVFKKQILPVNRIKLIYSFINNEVIFSNGVLVKEILQSESMKAEQLVVKTKAGKEVAFKTEKPLELFNAVKEMFSGGRI